MIYNMLEFQDRHGEEDTAYALAFGLWWMIIPHLAVISNAMLASNNPSALQGLIGDAAQPVKEEDSWNNLLLISSFGKLHDHSATGYWVRFLRKLVDMSPIQSAYGTHFDPVSVWRRGPNKNIWLGRVIESYTHDRQPDDMSAAKLKEVMEVGWGEWVDILVITLFLISAPFVLAFTTAYRIPRQGVSCRCLTFLFHFLAQMVQIPLWGWHRYIDANKVCGWPKIACDIGQAIFGFVAVFAALGGTLMQLSGIYRSCLCKVRT